VEHDEAAIGSYRHLVLRRFDGPADT
jgi:hypothetical protein